MTLDAGAGPPVTLVAVHGTGGNAAGVAEHWRSRWSRFGRRPLRLLCPQFKTPYQFLVGPADETPPDEALLDAVEDRSPGVRLCVQGFSGGAHFAHRFAMRHPSRVACCIAWAAGSWTAPDGAWTGMMAQERWLDRPEEHAEWADPAVRAAAHRPAAGPVDRIAWMTGCGDADLPARIDSAAGFAAALRAAGASVIETRWHGGHADEPEPITAAAVALMEQATGAAD